MDTLVSAHRANTEDLRAAFAATTARWDRDVDELHAALDDNVRQALLSAHPTTDSARARAILDRLQDGRPGKPPLSVTVLVWEELVGMVAFSDHIYLSTGLQDALPEDAALAFVLAHEIAHIDLGHCRLDHPRLPPLPLLPLRVGLGLATRAWMRPELELDADRTGHDLVRAVGYRADAFHEVFDVLSAAAIDKDMAALVSRDLSEWDEFWIQKATGYPTLQARRERLSARGTVSSA